MMKNSRKSDRGQLLVESLVAISVISVGILSVLVLLSQSISLNRVVSDQHIASYLAAEGVEIVKNIIDANVIGGRPWNEGINDGSYEIDYRSRSLGAEIGDRLNLRPVLFNAAELSYGYDGGAPLPFRREIRILNLADGEEIQVNSIVTWTTRGGGSFSVDAEDRFFNWRP